MYKSIVFIATILLLSCKTTTYYIVRHAEKASTATMTSNSMTSDVPLSDAGKQRAEALKETLKKEKIHYIFSTNYIRTKSTVQPLSIELDVPIEIYDPSDKSFVSRLKSLDKDALIVGHSNTIDDLVNELLGRKEINGDVPDSEYGNLFIVKKRGTALSFEKKHYGR